MMLPGRLSLGYFEVLLRITVVNELTLPDLGPQRRMQPVGTKC